MKVNTTKWEKGALIGSFNVVIISFGGNPNSALGFEMLEGLLPGNNATWSLSYQRTLKNNLQVNINYNGRQSENTRTIHAGGIQVRAFF